MPPSEIPKSNIILQAPPVRRSAVIMQTLRRPVVFVPITIVTLVLGSAGLVFATSHHVTVPHLSLGKSNSPSSPTTSSQQPAATTPGSPASNPSATTPAASPAPPASAKNPATTPSVSPPPPAAAPPAAPARTGSVYALLDPGESSGNMQTYANMANVDGLAFRARWSDLEPSNGSYNWSSVDSALSAASAKGKKVVIHVATTSIGTPSWLTGLGMQTYTYNTPAGSRTDPIPWDSTYMQQYGQLVAALGQHITAAGKMSVVTGVSADAPVSEMTIVGCTNGQLTGGVTYSRSNYLNAWKSSIAANANAYPGKKIYVSLPLSFICSNDGNDGTAFMTELMNATKATAGVSYFAADLNALGSTRTTQTNSGLKSSLGIGFQTIWSYTSDPQNRMQGSLSTAVCKGWNLGGRYFEIYKSDLTSADATIKAAINQATTGAGC